MSADNGHILRRNWDGKFVLQTYFASADSYPKISEARPSQIFDNLQDALTKYEECEADSPSEYGLTVHISEKTS